MNGRKVIVKTKWPQGPAIGTILEERKAGKYYSDGMFGYCMEDELYGWVEEVKEPEEFWFVSLDGVILHSSHILAQIVRPEFQFRTKESAEKLAKALKDSTKRNVITSGMFEVSDMLAALNDRVK